MKKKDSSQPDEISSVARQLIAHLGEQAPCHATYQALKARRRGDSARMYEWLWIAGATQQMLRSDLE